MYEYPYLIQLFRQGKFDWHKLIPFYNNPLWIDKYNKETDVSFILTKNSYEYEQGTYNHLQFCDIISDYCIIYTQEQCTTNYLCYWCIEKELCTSKFINNKNLYTISNEGSLCSSSYNILPNEKNINDSSLYITYPFDSNQNESFNISNCNVFIPQIIVSLDFAKPSSHKFLHFYRDIILPLFIGFKERDILYSDHILFVYSNEISELAYKKNYQHFVTFSNHCVLHINDIPKNTCLINYNKLPIIYKEERINDIELRETIRTKKYLDFIHIKFKSSYQNTFPKQPLFCLIKRITSRFILNEDELIQMIINEGYNTKILVFDNMPLEEQLYFLHQCDILAGIHGSGLSNSLYMRENTTLIQLFPYHICRGNEFFINLQKHINYKEWKNTHIENTVFHPHYLPNDTTINQVLEKQKRCVGTDARYFFSFWINQDTIVDLNEFKQVLLS